MISTCPPRPVLTPTALAQTAGTGEAARALNQQVQSLLAGWAESASLGAALRELADVRHEADCEGWSGEGAAPISDSAYQKARDFLSAILLAPAPSVSVEPSGEPAFDWQFGPNRWLVASIAPNGTVSYASRNGVSRERGITLFQGGVPREIARLLSELQRG